MRCRVTENEKGIGIFVGENFQLEVLLERAAQIDQVAAVVHRIAEIRERAVVGISLGDERVVSETRRNTARNVGSRGALGHLFDAAIGQSYVNRFHEAPSRAGETTSLSAEENAVKKASASGVFLLA